MSYDAIVVGGGHNGLVAGFSLARAGLRTVILERREIVGGACVTEEFAPGFRASTGAYVLSMLRESIWRDMRLVQRGLRVDAAGPTLNVFPDGAHYTVGDDADQTLEETRRFSRRDADAPEQEGSRYPALSQPHHRHLASGSQPAIEQRHPLGNTSHRTFSVESATRAHRSPRM